MSLSHWYIIFVAISHATKPRVVYDKKWSWYWYVIFVAISHATKPRLVYDKKWSWYWYIIFVAISHATKPCVVYDKKWSWYCKRVWYMETKTRYGIISLWDQRLVRNTLNIVIIYERVRVMVFNATFNNILVISWWSVLFEEETRVPRENH